MPRKAADAGGNCVGGVCSRNETEGVAGRGACRKVLEQCGEDAKNLDGVIAASETDHAYPSLSAQIHARLQMREHSTALDVGSGCLALLQVLCVAQAMLMFGPGEEDSGCYGGCAQPDVRAGADRGRIGGLFGEAPARFCCRAKSRKKGDSHTDSGNSFWMRAQYAEAISISDTGGSGLEIQFDARRFRARRLPDGKGAERSEKRSGISRDKVGAFCDASAKPAAGGFAGEATGCGDSTFPPIAVTKGNLGSSMCGATLQSAFEKAAGKLAM